MRTLLLISCLLVGRVAFAGEAIGVVVSADASLQPQLVAHLESWVRDQGDDVIASPLPAAASHALADCVARDDDVCAKNVIENQSRARVVVYARAEASVAGDGTHSVALTGHRFIKGGDVTAERRFCERCNDAALATTAADLMTALAKSSQGTTGTLRLNSTPAGAKVAIGDTAIGVTPLVHDLVPGPHDVTLVLDGHEIESRSVVIRAGDTTTIDVPLTPAHRDRPRRKLPAVLVIGGLAILGAGITLLAIDEDPSPTGPPEIRNTAPAGVGVTAAGGLALAVGIVLWLRPGSVRSTPVAAISRDSGFVGWSTSF